MAKTSITRLLLAALTFSITPLLTGQSTLNEDFTANPTTEFAPPWACSPPVILGHGDWLVMNARTNFNSSNTNRVDLDGSTARLSSDDNDAMGGYLALVHSFSSPLASWTLTVKVKVDEAYPDRPVPSCQVNMGFSPNDPCNLFPNDDPIGSLGWQAGTNQELLLRDGGPVIPTGYTLPIDGTWHFVEVISTPATSELRAWADGGSRPTNALAVGGSLGPAQRVHFGGPNFLNFDYSIDSVVLDAATLAPRFQRGDCNVDGVFNIADAVYLLGILFPAASGANTQLCDAACDANRDITMNIADAVFMLATLFPGSGTTAPMAEPLACDTDPSPPAMPLRCDLECP